MKKLLLSVALLLCLNGVHAQVEFGAKGGVNLSTVTGDVDDVDMGIGVAVGAFAKIEISDVIFIQPGLEVSLKGYSSTTAGGLKLTYLDVPVLLKFQGDGGLFGEVGPNLGLLFSATTDFLGEDYDVKDSFKGTDFGMNFGAGYEMDSGFGFGARYNLGLANISAEESFTAKNSVIQVYAFWLFGN